MKKPRFTPALQWVVNAPGVMTGEAQRILRAMIDTIWSRTGLETSKAVTGTAGASGRLAEWDANGDLVAASAEHSTYTTGTWTPVFVSTGATFSYAQQIGYYTKKGRDVTLNFRIGLNSSGNVLTANALTITGAPYAPLHDAVFNLYWHQSTSTLVHMTGRMVANTTITVGGITAGATTSLTALNSNAALHATNSSIIWGNFNYATA